jgi:phospholipase/carboxylesterase
MTNSTLDGPSVPPASGNPAKHAVVFLHGYGADGNDLIGLAPFFAQHLPDAAFFSPDAPLPGEMGFGRQWMSLHGYDPNMLRRDPNRMAGVFQGLYDGAVAAAEPLNAYLDGILAKLDLTAEALALIGFSQGTMMALHVGLRRAPQIGAVVGYSGALIGQDRLATERQASPPLLLVHGEADEVVPVQALSAARAALDAEDVAYSAHVVPGHGHGIEQTGAMLGRDFLKQHLVG